jgi:hypothetical protein
MAPNDRKKEKSDAKEIHQKSQEGKGAADAPHANQGINAEKAPKKPSFDRLAYQREYMRRRRALAKAPVAPAMTPLELMAIIAKLRFNFSRQQGVMLVCAELERRLRISPTKKRRDR